MGSSCRQEGINKSSSPGGWVGRTLKNREDGNTSTELEDILIFSEWTCPRLNRGHNESSGETIVFIVSNMIFRFLKRRVRTSFTNVGKVCFHRHSVLKHLMSQVPDKVCLPQFYPQKVPQGQTTCSLKMKWEMCHNTTPNVFWELSSHTGMQRSFSDTQ